MKVFRRSLIFGLLIMITILLLSGCKNDESHVTGSKDEKFNSTGLPVVDKKITLNVAGKRLAYNKGDFNEKSTMKALKEETNVHANWQLTPSEDWTEKRNLIFAGGDLPDVILDLEESDIVTYGVDQKMLIPLDELIEKHAPNLQAVLDSNPEFERMLTAPDGHIYTLPLIWEEPGGDVKSDTLWINKKWLEKVEMEVPKTTEEFKKALIAFKEHDVNGNGDSDDEIPFSFIFDDNLYGLNTVYGAFGIVKYSDFFMVRNDKVEFMPTLPEFKKAIEFYHSLYAEGLIDTEAFSQNESQYTAKLSGEEPIVGAWIGYGPSYSVQNTDYQSDYVAVLPPLKGNEGHQIKRGGSTLGISPAKFAITKANKHPKATIRWVDQVYDRNTSYEFGLGPNAMEIVDGKVKDVPPPEGVNALDWRYKESPVNDFVYALTAEMDENYIKPEYDLQNPNNKGFVKEAQKYVEHWYYPDLMFTSDELKKLSKYKTDINEFATTKEAEWLTKGGMEKEYDSFIEQLEKMGLQDMIEIYQTAYDRYISN